MLPPTPAVEDAGKSERRLNTVASELDLSQAARMPASQAIARLTSSLTGLSSAEATQRLSLYGPNAIRSHGAEGGFRPHGSYGWSPKGSGGD